MTMHSLHPDSHVYGLADDCERCAELAADPAAWLDQKNLARIIHDAVDQRRETLTALDAVAAASVFNTLQRAGHLYRTAPEIVGEFFSRYGIPVPA